MRIAIIACEIFKEEIEFLTKDDPDFVIREYLEFALHDNKKNMRQVITKKVNELEGKADVVLLGYAICQSLQDISPELKVPIVMFAGDDCIDVLLGPDEYKRERKKCLGTWFSTPGWAVQGPEGLIKSFHLDSVEGFEPSYFLNIFFESYERCLHIDTGIGNNEEYTQMSKDLADQLGLRLECRSCELKNIEDAVANVKKMTF